jgi:hypothetical protein
MSSRCCVAIPIATAQNHLSGTLADPGGLPPNAKVLSNTRRQSSIGVTSGPMGTFEFVARRRAYDLDAQQMGFAALPNDCRLRQQNLQRRRFCSWDRCRKP